VLELAAELSPELPGGHEAAIAATLMRSIEQLGAPGTAVLRLASLLSPAPIPHELLTATAVLADGCDASAAESTVGAGLADAARRSLAREASAGATRRWQVHALISRTVRHVDLHEARREHVRAAALSVLITELDKARERAQFQILADYLPHIAEVGRAWRGLDDRYALNEAARAYLELDLNDDAVALYAKLYESCERALGAQDPTTVAVLVGLGAAHGLRGDFDLAFNVKSRAYQTLLATVGPEDPDAITALNNIGIAHLDLRDPEPARRIFAQVYRARRGWNPQHTETIIALGNLAIATQACGRHALALRLKVAAYERMRRLRGDDDPYALEALNNLGAGQLAAGKRAAARATFARVYDGRRRAFGENHPATIGALENLAITEGDAMVLGDVYRRRVLGFDPGGPAALRSLHNLLIGLGGASGAPDPERQPPVAVAAGAVCPDAEVLTPLEDFDANTDRRVALFELAHRGHEAGVASFGPDAPGTMMALCRLAHATAALRQLETQIDDAVMLIDDASDGLRESLGANHPDAVLAERLREWIHQRVDAGTP
jgi:tetratricopeptide (TPR) repeat protein